MRTNYVLIDFENVQPDSVAELNVENFRVYVFVGASQSKVSIELVESIQALGDRGKYVRIAGNGKNALDLHIPYYIGRLSSEEPQAYFHIISKDTGFDPLLKHLRDQKIFAARVSSISEILHVKSAAANTPALRADLAIQRLRGMKECKPATVKTLKSTIASVFPAPLAPEEFDRVLAELKRRKVIAIDGTKVTYSLPSKTAP